MTVFLGDTVQLDGTLSRDADNDPLTFRWSFTVIPTDSRATLANPTIAKPTFVPDKLGLYVVQLIVNDGKKDSAPDTTSIKVNVEAPPNQRPIADAGQQQSGTVGRPVQLDGSNSNDPDEDPLTRTWTFAVKPGTSTAQLDDPKSTTPKFTPDVSGTYTLQLIVNDGSLDSLPSLVTITISDVGLNNPPIAHAGSNQTVPVSTTVQLTGVASDDLDNDPLTYQWTLTARPNGSTAQLSNATTLTPSSTADVAGEYIAQLIVNDGKVDSAPDTVKITVEAELPLAIAITTPTNNFLTNTTPVLILGTVDSRAQTVTVDGIAATLTGTSFSVNVPVKEGNNTVTAIARTSTGKIGTANVTIVRDSTPPNVVIESPVAAQIITEPQVTVVGMVNDIVTGTVNQENCTVEISGPAGTRTATVSNRTFRVPDFPLTLAVNSLNATATDTAGNKSAPFQIQVIRQAPQGPQLHIVSGNDQTGVIGATLPTPLVVKVSEEDGVPIAGKAVLFQVVRNNGLLQELGVQEDKSEVTVVTDANGQASVSWTLGTRAGTGNNRVEVSAPGIIVPVLFNASATPMPCDRLLTMNGENQVGAVDKALARSFEVVAVDPGGNVCAGIAVTFRVENGDGNFAGLPAVVVQTNSDGRASAILTLGPTAGVNNNVVSASFPGVGDFSAHFRASAVASGPESATRFVGVVLDTEDRPIPQVHVEIENTNPVIESITDEKGQFVLTGVPTGSGLLLVKGDTTPRAGAWPPLEFHIDVIAGIDNTLGMPIYLPELNSSGFRSVGGSEDTILEMPGVEGFTLKIFANSATFPNGSKTGVMGVTQVSNDQVPMPPPGGLAPAWVLTLQPPGVRLNPPAQLTMPNAYGLPPGQIIDIFSFDHDLQQFVSVGTATVQPDGAMIVSDPGSGIRKSGWGHGPPPPPPPGTAGGCAGTGPCPQPPPSCQGQSCNDFNPCNGLEFCDPQSGLCQSGPPLSNGVACNTPCVSGGTCQSGSCTGGTPITPTDNPNDCMDPVCQRGSLSSQPDNSEIPIQASLGDCKEQVCQNGQIVSAPKPSESPFVPQNSTTDCQREICIGDQVTSIPNDLEIPPQTPGNCTKEICSGGSLDFVLDSSDTPPDSLGNCKRGVCISGFPIIEADDTDTPPDILGDCHDEICTNGIPGRVESVSNTRPQTLGDCRLEICFLGIPTTAPDGSDTRPEIRDDCKKEICSNDGNPGSVSNDLETCEDGNPLTTSDHCENGVCVGDSCNGIPFDPVTQGCCGGSIYDRATECCGLSRVADKSDLSDLSQCPNRTRNPLYIPFKNGCTGVPDNPNLSSALSNPALEVCLLPGQAPSFKDACDLHDLCYDNCGTNKIDCDALFLYKMLNICSTVSNPICKSVCTTNAILYASGQNLIGLSFYETAQRNACLQCCP